MSKKIVLVAIAAFLLGILSAIIYTNLPVLDLQKPLDLFGSDNEKSSPSDKVKDYNILAFDDKIVMYIKDPYLARFTNTHSMEPLINEKSTGLEIAPKSSSEIKIGDIISYNPKNSDDAIIHRVVKIGQDSEGWYALAKGDNNPSNDPEKIRFGQVKRVLVGILY